MNCAKPPTMINVPSGNAIRTQQALLTALFSTAHAQFCLVNDLIEALAEALRNTGPAGDNVVLVETLITRFSDRTERTIADLQCISSELRDNASAASTTTPAQATAAMTDVVTRRAR